ncbi:glycerophosphodiester phosphodiesterase [Mangrovihabitans endophyticus]|uniref:glycerophosphodiester phosphodiesterase n=1 Tax=Mangrovihabitans endophyticus TaxID=1751298 RepID=A0A8J3FQ92_9ACTN|nr:glycerophosphodiester phosphodiesterase [Mangrovihabitans endophyticus]GGK96270.1 glycerophosphoryl diester phosphodiesterase [Mangrovihabitans endophyticus]
MSTAPLVIGHRGACGYRPEHTLESYQLAIRLGADYIEPDLVSTADGVLVARHENEISGTTDVTARPEFADRRTTKIIGGRTVTGWFTEDFTLAELRTLRAVERLPSVRPQNTLFDGEFSIPTLQEILDLARAEERRLGRAIGVYPETKLPSHFQSIGLALEEPLVSALHANGLTGPSAPVLIQSFEAANLRKLRSMTDLRLIQLLDEPGDLRTIAEYAYGVGPDKDLIVPRDAAGRLRAPTTLVSDAHAAGLAVHAWTFRAENPFLPLDHRIGDNPAGRGDGIAEYELFLRLGVDGVFTDHPDTAVAAISAMQGRPMPVPV